MAATATVGAIVATATVGEMVMAGEAHGTSAKRLWNLVNKLPSEDIYFFERLQSIKKTFIPCVLSKIFIHCKL